MGYQVVRSIGRGGMAEVFLARAADGSSIALKRLLPAHRDNAEFQRMFRTEGEIGLCVQHPNVVRTLEVGRDAEGPFIALEYLEGIDVRGLRRRLAERGARIPVAVSLYVMIGVLDALHGAHRAKDARGRPLGVVHRDVSPSNVLLTTEGRVKLIDFGVARRDLEEPETRAGTIKGKIAYMAPEQLRHEVPDGRADVYSAGVMAYELLLGRRPYAPARGEFDLMLAIVRHEIVAPHSIDPHFSDALAEILTRAMALDRAHRFASAADMSRALRELAARDGHSLDAAGLLALMETEPAALSTRPLPLPPEPDSASLSFGHLLGPGVPWITPEVIAGVTVIALEGSLSAVFPGAALGEALSGEVLFDLNEVDRMNQEGMHAWRAMVEAASKATITFARLPEAMLPWAQVPGFFGRGALLSFEAPLRCASCGAVHVVLLASQALGARVPHDACPACGSQASFVGGAELLHALREATPRSVSASLNAAAREVDARRAADERLVEKRVDGQITRIRFRRAPPRAFRYGRSFEGVEGVLELDLRGLRAATAEECERLGRVLLALGGEITAVRVENCPPPLTRMLEGDPRFEIARADTRPPKKAAPRLRLPFLVAAAIVLLATGAGIQQCHVQKHVSPR